VRLLHVIEGLHPDRGGPPQVAVALAARQLAAGHEVAFASHDAKSEAVGEFLRGRGLAACERIEVARCGPLGTRAFAAAMTGTARPDAMHLHGVWNAILPQSARWAREAGVPYCLTTHGALHPFPMARGRWKKMLALATTHGAMLRGARRIFVLNDEERDAVAARFGASAETLPNGVDVGPEPSIRSRRERPLLVFLGRLDWTKGIEALVAAHGRVIELGLDCDLVIVGNDWGSRGSIEAAIDEAGTRERVQVVGPKYGEEKRRVLAEASLLVHLPRYEGFGMAVLEGLAVGTPAVIGDRCLLPGAGPSMGVVVTESNPDSFARGVAELLRDPARREALSRAGRHAVVERFGWDAIAARCVEALSPTGNRR
jgi:glycosyltransferase involved in cell wall biosynthesis